MCKIICHILFYYSIMIKDKSIKVLIIFSIKFNNHEIVVFLQKLSFSTNLVFLLVKLLCFRLTISSVFLELPLMTICFSVSYKAPFFKCINIRFAASADYVGLETGPWSLRRRRPFMMCQLVTLHSTQTVGLHFQELLNDASYK